MSCNCPDCISDKWCGECDANLWREDVYYVKGRMLCDECANPPDEAEDEE